MYKLAIVGIVLSGVLMSAAIAQAKPVGMSNAENRALVIRSEGLNQKYGVGQKSQQAIIREKLGEIGAWAVPSTSTDLHAAAAIIREKLGEIGAWAVPSTSTQTEVVPQSQQAIIREKLGEIGAWAVPSNSTQTEVVPKSLPTSPRPSSRLAATGSTGTTRESEPRSSSAPCFSGSRAWQRDAGTTPGRSPTSRARPTFEGAAGAASSTEASSPGGAAVTVPGVCGRPGCSLTTATARVARL